MLTHTANRVLQLLLLATLAATARPVELFVSPKGADTSEGSMVHPFATLEKARDTLRELRGQERLDEGATVWLRAGTHRLGRTFTLGKQDGGTEQAPVTYRSWPGETVVVTGAHRLSGFTPFKGEILQLDTREQGFTNRRFRQLFLDGERQIVARYPNYDPALPHTGGYAYASGEIIGTYKKLGNEPQDTILVRKSDLRTWAHLEDGEVDTSDRYNWNNNISGIASMDHRTRILTMTRKARHAVRAGCRYFVRNLFEELDAPGEWFHDPRTWTLYFWPPRPLEGSQVTATKLEDLIRLEQTSHIVLRGLVLEGADSRAVYMQDCTSCILAGCTIRSISSRLHMPAVQVAKGHANRIDGNDISHCAGTGVSLTGWDAKARKKLTPSGNVVENNYIHHLGWLKKNAWGVGVTGIGNRIAHNLIHDNSRGGIFIMHANDTIIEYNHIRHVNLATNDTGGIYQCAASSGWRCRGNVIRYNFLHDIIGFGKHGHEYKPHYDASGIYLDDSTCETRVHGNIVARTSLAGIFVHGGSDHLIDNNIVVDAKYQLLFSAWYPPEKFWKRIREELPVYSKLPAYAKYKGFPNVDIEQTYRMTGISATRNILCYSDPKAFLYTLRKLPLDKTTIDRNLVVGPDRMTIRGFKHAGGGSNWSAWREAGHDQNSVLDDPAFVDAAADDYRLKPESPAWKLGFERIPIERMGPFESKLRTSWPIIEESGVRENPIQPFHIPPEPGLGQAKSRAAKPRARLTVSPKPIAIDGVISPDEWPAGSELILGKNPACTARVCRRGDTLFVAVRVELAESAKLVLDGDWGVPDAAEICFRDQTDSAKPGRTYVVQGFARGLCQGGKDPGVWSREGDGLAAATAFTATTQARGWTGEWAIPMDTVGISLAKNKTLGFNIGVRRTSPRGWLLWARTGASTWVLDNAGTLTP
ncbi:MAG: right-handed parallel beta-helix repeat-containing protein [Lentisphaeria bacterium]|nr:right-handed parallel beta-helix repeat-containing protein [Lentisphaeria bacterium]